MLTVAESLDRARLLRLQNQGAQMSFGIGARGVAFLRGRTRQALYQAQFTAPPAADMASINAAKAALADIDRKILRSKLELGRLRTEAVALEGATEAAGRASRTERLRSRGLGLTKHGANVGPVTIGQGGITWNRGFITSTFGGAFKVGVVGNVAAGVTGLAANIKDRIEAGEKPGDIAAGIPGAALKALLDIFGVTRTTSGIARLLGKDAREAETALDDLFDDIGRRATGRLSNAEERLKVANEQRTRTFKAIDDALGQKWSKIESWMPADFRLVGGANEVAALRKEMREEFDRKAEAARAILRTKAQEQYRDTRDGGGE